MCWSEATPALRRGTAIRAPCAEPGTTWASPTEPHKGSAMTPLLVKAESDEAA